MHRATFAIVVALVLITCTPTEPCSCPPVPIEAEVHGIVASSGEPVAGATVRTYARAGTCPASEPWPDVGSSTTNAAGEYWRTGYAYPPATQFCLRVVATRSPQGDSAVSEQVVVDSLPAGARPKTFRVDVLFPDL